MVIFNLLPWRADMRRYQTQKIRKIVGIITLLVFILLLSMHLMLTVKEKKLQLHVTELKKQWISYRHEYSLPHKNTPGDINQNKRMKDLLAELSRLDLPALCFTDIETSDKVVQFRGLTYSAYDLTKFFNTWDMKNLFSEIRIQKIDKQSNGLMQFAFQAQPI